MTVPSSGTTKSRCTHCGRTVLACQHWLHKVGFSCACGCQWTEPVR